MRSPSPIPLRSASWVRAVSQRDRDRRFGCHLLDVRPSALARRDHLPGSASLPVEGSVPRPGELPSHLLPERNHELVVLDRDVERALRIGAHLRDRGFRVACCNEPLPHELLEPGPAPGALWRADPLLASSLPLLPSSDTGSVLDLGGGSGRDTVFLAQHGYDCLLIDRLPEALEMARERARRHGVTLGTLKLDLRDAESIPPGPFAAILSIRFLQRAALAKAASRVHAPGGVVVLRTFADPPPAAGDPRISPASKGFRPHRPQHRLGLAELARVLPSDRWTFPHPPRIVAWHDDLWLEAVALAR